MCYATLWCSMSSNFEIKNGMLAGAIVLPPSGLSSYLQVHRLAQFHGTLAELA